MKSSFRYSLIFLLLLAVVTTCQTTQEGINQPMRGDHFLSGNASSEDWLKDGLHGTIEIQIDSGCSRAYQEVSDSWVAIPLDEYINLENYTYDNPYCHWTRVAFMNPSSTEQTHYIYFEKGWHSLTTYYRVADGSIQYDQIGVDMNKEILPVRVPPQDTLFLYTHYPTFENAILPGFTLGEISETRFIKLGQRTSLKYLFMGFLGFPVLFFFFIFILEKDRITFAYLLFLAGSTLNLITILDATPFFDFTPKIIENFTIIQGMFVVSGLLSLGGLIKYIHYLIDLKSWSRGLWITGQAIIILFTLVVIIPFLFTSIFSLRNYQAYVDIYRVVAFIHILYILTICLVALFKRIKFSGILTLAFIPFILSALFYAFQFLAFGSYSSSDFESLALIAGFDLTILLFGIILGIRNRKMREDKIRLEEETVNLREINEFKNRFYTNFTHEFRTPLTVIKGMTDQIDGHVEQKNLIQRNSDRLLNTVNDLLDLSKLETKKLPLNWTHGDTIGYLHYLTDSFSSLAEKKGIDLQFTSSEDSVMMDYDAHKLQQIISNLISNAIKFTPKGGYVKVVVDRFILQEKEVLQIQVSDTGKGIPAEDLGHIFDRFYQAGTMNHAEGTGIGLALVKELTLLMDGHVDVKSTVPEGTLFHIELPILNRATNKSHSQDEVPVPQILTHEKVEEANTIHSPTDANLPIVLLMEDNNDVAEYIIYCLQSHYCINHVLNGKEGVDKAIETIPDVIISDVMMPEMDGIEACHLLKEDRRTSHIPVILLTAKATREDRLSGFRVGADAYLIKPFDKEELMMRLENMAAQSRLLKEGLSNGVYPDYAAVLAEKEKEFLDDVNSLILQNMENEEFDTQFLCREIAMSRTQLHRKLKALTGYSTATYIRTIRLNQAHELLLATDLPVGDIALQVGYKDFSHFSRSYTGEFGHNPSHTRTT